MTAEPKRLRVVTLIDEIGGGGGAEILAELATERLDPDRFHRTMVLHRLPTSAESLERQANAAARLRGEGVEVVQLTRRRRFDLVALLPLLRLLRSGCVDVLHSHKVGSNVWGTALSRLADVPVVVAHEHTWAYQGNPVRLALDRFLIGPGCDAFVAVSRLDAERMHRIEKVPSERIQYLPNGIPTPAVRDVDARALLGVPATGPLVGSVGILRDQKDFPTMLRAFARVRSTFPDAHLVIVGYGPERERIDAEIAGLGLVGGVTITGLRDDVPDLLPAFDVAVNSSLYEGASLAIMEYMAAARPIVATRVGGTPDLLDDGRAGVLVDAGDVDGMASAMADLLANPARARELGNQARARQRTEYDIDVHVRRLADLYEHLLRTPTHRRRGRRARAALAVRRA